MGHLGEQHESAAVDAELVRNALAEALASPEFRLSARMSQFLRFVVEAALSDRAGEVKETVIGVEVFGRPPDYDPKTDPVVRKEAARLRAKLASYYLGSGSGAKTRIELPKGHYVPVFFSPQAGTLPPTPPPAPVANRKRPPWALPAAIAFVLLAGGVMVFRGTGNGPVLVPQLLTGNGGDEHSPAFSPDGREIAFAWQSPQDREAAIYVQALHGDAPRRLTSYSDYENFPAWSPDGHRIAFVRRMPEGRIAICARTLADGTERTVTEIRAPAPLDWSPDGESIAASDGVAGAPASIVLIAAANGGRRQITIPAPGVGDTVPHFSPDGVKLAFLRAVSSDVAELFILDWKTAREPHRLTFENRKIEGFTWAPDGRSLVVSLARGATSRSLWRVPLDGGSLERIAVAGTATYTPVWSRKSGVLAYALLRNDINLWRIRSDLPGAPAMVAGSSVLDSSPAFAPDGRHLAFRSARSGTNEIWTTGLFADTPVRITHMDGPLTGGPSWSPDGKWIAFDSRVRGNSSILVAPSSGGPWRSITDTPDNEVLPRWSRNGEWIYFSSDRGGRWQVWRRSAAGGAATQVTFNGGYAAAESPDSRYLYYTRSVAEPGLYRLPIAGGKEEVVLPDLAGKLWGNWALTEGGVYYLNYPERAPTESTIRYLDFAAGQSREIFRLPKHPVLWDGGLAVTPDGAWLVFAELDHLGSNIQYLEPFR